MPLAPMLGATFGALAPHTPGQGRTDVSRKEKRTAAAKRRPRRPVRRAATAGAAIALATAGLLTATHPTSTDNPLCVDHITGISGRHGLTILSDDLRNDRHASTGDLASGRELGSIAWIVLDLWDGKRHDHVEVLLGVCDGTSE
jgi:hypothetical protein